MFLFPTIVLVGITAGLFWASVLSDPLSSLPFSCPFTGTSTSTFPPGRSGSSIVTVIGPSTFLPGVTSTSPVSGLITTGMSFPSSSFAVTLVSLSGFLTFTPVPCFSSVGSTGFLPVASTDVFLSSCEGVVSFTVTGTSTVSFDPSG